MKNESVFWVMAAAVGAGFGLLVAFGASGAAIILMIGLGILSISAVGRTMRREVDEKWLASWIVLGFVAKMAGTYARYYMVMYL
ncbi:MAG TPA: hypothetical protein VLS86_08700, partial [Acidimicrobiia bacterium]|nr:hypothetical protein [Acidimicrobiia bacterium]